MSKAAEYVVACLLTQLAVSVALKRRARFLVNQQYSSSACMLVKELGQVCEDQPCRMVSNEAFVNTKRDTHGCAINSKMAA